MYCQINNTQNKGSEEQQTEHGLICPAMRMGFPIHSSKHDCSNVSLKFFFQSDWTWASESICVNCYRPACHTGKGSLVWQRRQCSTLRKKFLVKSKTFPAPQLHLAEWLFFNPPLTSSRRGEGLAFLTDVIERRGWRLKPTCLGGHQSSSLSECKEGELTIGSRMTISFKLIYSGPDKINKGDSAPELLAT